MRLIGSFERQVSFIFIALTLGNIGNFIFHIYMGRYLPETEYGILYRLLALLMIVSVPAATIQTVITKYTAHFKVFSQYGKIRFLLFNFLKRLSAYGFLGFLIFLAASGRIASWQHFPSNRPVMILGVLLLLSVIAPAAGGVIQGLQRFDYLGWSTILGTASRLIFGIIFVFLGLGVNGALAASILAILVGICILFFPLKFLFKPKETEEKVDFKEIYRYSAPVIFSVLFFMILTNIDVLLVGNFFDPIKAETYSTAAFVGRMILFLPLPIVVVMFPKASELYAQRRDSSYILKRSLLYVGLLAGGATLVCFLFPSLIIKLIWAGKYQASTPLVGKFALAMTLFGLVNILLFYQLSIHRFKYLYWTGALTLIQIVAITLFHNTLSQVVWILVVNGLLLFIVNQFLVWMPKRVPLRAQKTTEDTEKIL
ncbi:MAG TPA: hypothetical protein ENH97_01065 [bacterium]|nr:hypothetical protein [bacterium]